MQIKFNHVYSEYDPKAKALHPGHYTVMSLKTIDEMKEVIKKYNIQIKDENYFVKKPEIELKETLQ